MWESWESVSRMFVFGEGERLDWSDQAGMATSHKGHGTHLQACSGLGRQRLVASQIDILLAS